MHDLRARPSDRIVDSSVVRRRKQAHRSPTSRGLGPEGTQGRRLGGTGPGLSVPTMNKNRVPQTEFRMSGNRAGLLFDLDGTLVDTNYLHALAWSRAFRSVGHWAPMNAIHRLLGMSGDQLVLELLARPCPAAAKAQEGYFAELIGEAAAFPGATALVREAHELGLRAVLASSAPTEDLEVYIDILDIASHVDAVTSADDVKESKPAPDVFRIAMDAGGLDRARSLAIGDTVWDVHAAGVRPASAASPSSPEDSAGTN